MKKSKHLNIVELKNNQVSHKEAQESEDEKIKHLYDHTHNFFYGYYGHEYIKLIEHTTETFRRGFWLECFRRHIDIDISTANELAVKSYPYYPPNVGQFERLLEQMELYARQQLRRYENEKEYEYEFEDEDEDADADADADADE